MVNIIVRPARREDQAAWRAMRAALYGEDLSLLPEVEAFFAGRSTIDAVFIAEAGHPVGFVELGRRAYAEGCRTSPVAYLEGLYVEAAYRRCGVGEALVRAAELWAREHGLRELASDALIENHGSLAAHRSYGFAEVERIVCFRKDLEEPQASPLAGTALPETSAPASGASRICENTDNALIRATAAKA